MSDFILYSIIGSIVLTVLINVLPMLFPIAADKLQKKLKRMHGAILSNIRMKISLK